MSQGVGQWFCDDNSKALVIKKHDDRGGGPAGGQKCKELRDVIYRRPIKQNEQAFHKKSQENEPSSIILAKVLQTQESILGCFNVTTFLKIEKKFDKTVKLGYNEMLKIGQICLFE